jgi:hypothetical protein
MDPLLFWFFSSGPQVTATFALIAQAASISLQGNASPGSGTGFVQMAAQSAAMAFSGIVSPPSTGAGITHNDGLRTAMANLVVGNFPAWASGPNQVIKVYAGIEPATCATPLSGNVLLSTITAITWGTATNGQVTMTSSSPDTNVANTGTATFFRIYQTAAVDPTNAIFQGSVGLTAADMTVTSTLFVSGGSFTLINGASTYTAPQ